MNLDFEVYEALLDMAAKTRAELADMNPVDLIDVQSFMWTVVKYTAENAPERARA